MKLPLKLSLATAILVLPWVITTAYHRLVIHAHADAAPSAPKLVPAVTLHYEEFHTELHGPNPATTNTESRIVAYRANGDRSEVSTLRMPGRSPSTLRNLKLMSGDRLMLWDTVKAKSTMALPPDTIAGDYNNRLFDPKSGCIEPLSGVGKARHTTVDLNRQVIDGYSVFVFTSVSGNGRAVMYRAPEFNCFLIKQVAEFTDKDGAVTDRSETKLVKVEPGEPSAALFDTGDFYQEVAPSKASELAGNGPSNPANRGMQALDDRYNQHKKR